MSSRVSTIGRARMLHALAAVATGTQPYSSLLGRRRSASRYRPHTAKAGSREAARRRRQIEKGMLQTSAPWERKELSRTVKPHRNKRYS